MLRQVSALPSFLGGMCSPVDMDHVLLIQSSVCWWALGLLGLSTIGNNATLAVDVQVSVRGPVFNSFGGTARDGMADHVGILFYFARSCTLSPSHQLLHIFTSPCSFLFL